MPKRPLTGLLPPSPPRQSARPPATATTAPQRTPPSATAVLAAAQAKHAPAGTGEEASAIQCQKSRRVSYFESPRAKRARLYRVRKQANGRNVATAKYRILSTNQFRSKTMSSRGLHSEKRLYDWLERHHPGDYRVLWLYTELETCGSDYHNCTARVSRWFPHAKVYYSVDYPSEDDVSSDSDDGVTTSQERKTAKAKRRRNRGPKALKRFQTVLTNRDNAGQNLDGPVDMDDFNPYLRVPYSPYHGDSDEDPGITL
jgi:hypothetical protein